MIIFLFLLFLFFICMNRYMAIMNPLQPRMGKRTTILIAVLIWISGIIISSPMLSFFTTYKHEMKGGGYRIVCYGEWPDGPTTESFQEYV